MEADLVQHYNAITQELQVLDPPKIGWAPVKEMYGFKGTYNRSTNEIKIADELQGQPAEHLNYIIVHEITHYLINQAGYRSLGHGWQFLAAFALLLHRLVMGGAEEIEGCICGNWPKWPSWPIWYSHFSQAHEVYSKVSQQVDFQHLNGLQIADAVLAEGKKMHPLLNGAYHFFLHLSHNVIADTRGHWLACRYVAIGCFIIGFALSWAGFQSASLPFYVTSLFFITVFGKALGKQTKQKRV